MARRFYSNVTGTGTLDSAVGAGDTSFTVSGFSSTPTTPFTAVVDRGLAAEEVVLVTAVSGGTLTVQRGYDSTPATSHSGGATIEHAIIAEGPNRWDAHSEATSDVHGISGSFVDADSAQTLTNKTLTDGQYQAANTSSPGAAGLYIATVDNTNREGFVADTTGTAATGTGFAVQQSGSDRWAVMADGSVSVTPSGSPTWAHDVTGNARVSGDETVTGEVDAGTLTVSGASTLDSATLGTTLGVTGATTVTTLTASGLVTAQADADVSGDLSVAGSVDAEGNRIVSAQSGGHTVLTSEITLDSGTQDQSLRQPWMGVHEYTNSMPRTLTTSGETFTISLSPAEDGYLYVVATGYLSPSSYSGSGTKVNSALFELTLENSGGTTLETGVQRRAGVADDGDGGFLDTTIVLPALFSTRLTAGTTYQVQLLGDRNPYTGVLPRLNNLWFYTALVANADG